VERVAESVLVVDDDDVIRRLLDVQLSRLGYSVTTAADASEAIERHAGRRIDVLVTDVVMPGMDGPELASAMREANPDLRVLFLSGYGTGAASQGAVAFLQKPFSSDELAAALDGLRGA
jgi:CheY-like chemotaxis protein